MPVTRSDGAPTRRIRVPATTANLGPGFDCLGAAVSIGLELTWGDGPAGWTYSHSGIGPAHDAPEPALVLSAAARVLGEPPSAALRMSSGIPMGCGLGSSASAIAAGLLLGRALSDREPDPSELLVLGTPLEGHADNLAPALFGGVTLVLPEFDGVDVLRFEPDASVRPVILLPRVQLS